MKAPSLRAVSFAMLCGALYVGCSSEEKTHGFLDTAPEQPNNGGDGDDTSDEPDASTNTSDVPDASNGADAGADAGDGGTVVVYNNCGEAICAGTKKCVENPNGAVCECDSGFISHDLGNGNFECVTDTSCIFMRALNCNQDPHAAVYQAFHVQYCSGEPVPPTEIDVDQSFAILQDNVAPDPNEAYWTFRVNHVESAVVVALDASGSVINDAVRFEPLIDSIRDFVKQLRPTPTDPPIRFGMLLFGRTVGEFITPTPDLAAVDAQLADLQANGAGVAGIDPGGTALNDAVGKGISLTQAARNAIELDVSGGALTFGTLVVITDGDNESGTERLDTEAIKNTTVSVVSMGINIDLADSVLTSIGKDGSFLAPDKRVWDSTLTEVARRVRARTDSIYEVAYCSPATQEKHDLSTGMADTELHVTEATCKNFDAALFEGFTSNECKTFVDTECSENTYECGGDFQVCPYSCSGGEVCVAHACTALESL